MAHIDEFGLNPSYTVSYTGQSIYAPNTLERPVKSAILTGNTLSANPLSVLGQVSSTINDDNSVTMNGDGAWHHVDYDSSNYVGNKATFVVLFSENTIGDDLSYFQFVGFNVKNKVINTNSFKCYGTITDSRIRFGLHVRVQSGSVTFRVMLLDGDYSNHDIPYFEGIKSVKTPVLTTSNEDDTKTNILTVNEDVTLRGIDDVQDTLDCLTGEVTERIGVIVLDGSDDEKWAVASEGDITNGFSVWKYVDMGNASHLICDKLNYYDSNSLSNDKTNFICYKKATKIIIVNIKNLKSINEVKQWLSQNPITVQYQLATESIKTVDLTILDQNGQNVKQLMSFNGGTHFNTGSLEGSLLPSVSVSVETDLEETLKVCSLEGNTM